MSRYEFELKLGKPIRLYDHTYNPAVENVLASIPSGVNLIVSHGHDNVVGYFLQVIANTEIEYEDEIVHIDVDSMFNAWKGSYQYYVLNVLDAPEKTKWRNASLGTRY